jgi:hypothetical protein
MLAYKYCQYLVLQTMNQQLEDPLKDTAPYSFDNLVGEFKWLIGTLPESRTGLNTTYSIADAALGAFSVFFMQSPSFLAHQARMQDTRGHNNAQSLFQITNIPSDNQIRNLLDPISPEQIAPMFDFVFNGLNSVGYFEHYRSINKTILIAIDGVNYFSSDKINCERCSTKHHKSGKVEYLHNAITPVIVAPDNPRVISLTPEYITPQDGHDKQDGEHAATKRWLQAHGSKYKELGITILGDDLYSHQPICEAILQAELHFILTCKPDSHIKLYEAISGHEASGQLVSRQVERIQGKKVIKKFIDTYRFYNNLPIRGTEDALMVNWCELITTDEAGQVVFINSYITDHLITLYNVEDVIKAGRTRWKCENEHNNTLKNHGYHMEHSFGHGKQYLSQTLLSFNLLAFLFHTVLSIMDVQYHTLREKLRTRQKFFDGIRVLTMYLFFNNWDKMLKFMLEGLEQRHDASKLFEFDTT